MSNAIALLPAKLADAPALLAFELANRAYFERYIDSRGDDFYTLEAVGRSLTAIEADRAADKGHGYLVWRAGCIVGRLNLTAIERKVFHAARLGYRIAESEAGRGVASEAVRQGLALAFGEHRLWRVEATASAFNIGSRRVLEKNGFSEFGRSRRSLWRGDGWHDLHYFERHAEPA